MVDSYDSIPINIINLEVSNDIAFNDIFYMFDGYEFQITDVFYPLKLKFLLKIYDTTDNYASGVWSQIKYNLTNGLKKNLTLDNEIYQFSGNVYFLNPPVCIIHPSFIEIQIEFIEV
jgi:hypothetical protein